MGTLTGRRTGQRMVRRMGNRMGNRTGRRTERNVDRRTDRMIGRGQAGEVNSLSCIELYKRSTKLLPTGQPRILGA